MSESFPRTARRGAALVTGAARRIGRAIALRLAREGYDVAIHYGTSATEAEEVAEEIRHMGRRAVPVRGDLADPETPLRIVLDAHAALGQLDVLVNNASRFEPDTLQTLTLAEWEAHLGINLRAPVFLAQAFAGQRRDRGRQGNVINIIDQRVLRLNPTFFSYTLSKAALWTATRTMAQALAPENIRVNAIGPGPTLANARMTEEDFARQCALTLLGCGTTPEEIADAVLFIISAPAMTGQMIVLDGGQHLNWQTPDITEVSE
jgi:NAD(P)-dependent dehydrogenase (short-subunit alcohol dehydrogenase family)